MKPTLAEAFADVEEKTGPAKQHEPYFYAGL